MCLVGRKRERERTSSSLESQAITYNYGISLLVAQPVDLLFQVFYDMRDAVGEAHQEGLQFLRRGRLGDVAVDLQGQNSKLKLAAADVVDDSCLPPLEQVAQLELVGLDRRILLLVVAVVVDAAVVAGILIVSEKLSVSLNCCLHLFLLFTSSLFSSSSILLA